MLVKSFPELIQNLAVESRPVCGVHSAMEKGKIEEGDEVNLRATIARIWPDGQITVSIKSASVIDRVTLLNDSDIIETFKAGEPRRPLRRERLV